MSLELLLSNHGSGSDLTVVVLNSDDGLLGGVSSLVYEESIHVE